jgi:hypothetical protein
MNKQFARPTKSVNLQNYVNAYVSDCCNVLAEKPSVKDNEGALGTWRCSGCRRVAKVRPVDKSKFTAKSQVEVNMGGK